MTAAEAGRAERSLAAVPLPAGRRRRRRQPFQLDSAEPSVPYADFAASEARFSMLARSDPERSRELVDLAQPDVDSRWQLLPSSSPASSERHPATPRRGTLADDARTSHEPVDVDLTTTYLGLRLRSPLVASAGPLTGRSRRCGSALEARRRRRDRAALAVRGADRARGVRRGRAESTAPTSFGEALVLPARTRRSRRRCGRRATSALVEQARERLTIPVIASLNGTTPGGWVHYARHARRAPAPMRSS